MAMPTIGILYEKYVNNFAAIRLRRHSQFWR
jgi:hypothetical protein